LTEVAPGRTRRTLLGKNSAIYGLGALLGMAGSLVLIPFVTRALGPAPYGAFDLFNRTADIVVALGLLGMRQAFIRHYYDQDSDEWRARASSTTLIFALCVAAAAIVLGLLATFLLPNVGRRLGFGPLMGLLLGATAAAQLVFAVSTVFLQVRNEALKFVSAQLGMMLLYVGAVLFALYALGAGVVGVVVANIFASLIVAALCSGYLISKSGFAFDRAVFREMLRFGAPYLPTIALGVVASSADRYVLASQVSLEQLGIYALAARIASAAMTLVSAPLERVWTPFAFEATLLPNARKIIGNAMFAYVFVIAATAAGAAACTPMVFPLLAPANFSAAIGLVPLFCMFEALASSSNATDTGILIAKRTWLKPIVTGVHALAVVSMLALLVPRFGIFGAATAVVLAGVARIVINLWLSNRCYPVDVPKRLLLFTVVWIGGALIMSANFLNVHLQPLMAAAAGAGILLVGAYLVRSHLHVSYHSTL
jgi:O-antigen/teichoic acid export membrane protein